MPGFFAHRLCHFSSDGYVALPQVCKRVEWRTDEGRGRRRIYVSQAVDEGSKVGGMHLRAWRTAALLLPKLVDVGGSEEEGPNERCFFRDGWLVAALTLLCAGYGTDVEDRHALQLCACTRALRKRRGGGLLADVTCEAEFCR